MRISSCVCAQSMALGPRTKFQLEILTINVISSIVYFRKIILESSRNVSETTHRYMVLKGLSMITPNKQFLSLIRSVTAVSIWQKEGCIPVSLTSPNGCQAARPFWTLIQQSDHIWKGINKEQGHSWLPIATDTPEISTLKEYAWLQ